MFLYNSWRYNKLVELVELEGDFFKDSLKFKMVAMDELNSHFTITLPTNLKFAVILLKFKMATTF